MIFRVMSLIILPFLIISCSKKVHNSTSNEVIVYPSPPDTARVQFLTKFSNSSDIVNKKSSFSKFVVGEEKVKGILKPYGLAIYDGKIFICDLDLPGLEIIDLKIGSFDFFVPKGLGRLKLPINCFVDNNGSLYVADVTRKQIVVFDKELNYVDAFGEAENFKPTDVFVTEDKIWVANIKGKIHVYSKDSSHKLLNTIPKLSPEEDGFLRQPTNIAVTGNALYTSDFGEFKIKIYTHDGEYVRSVGTYGRNIGQFARPKGIAVDKDDNLFVADAAFENVQIFNKNDQLLMFFGGPYKGPGDMWLPAKVIIDYDNIKYFEQYVDKRFKLKYLILVSNNFGPDKINVYGYIEPK